MSFIVIYLFLIGGQLLYNIVLVSATHPHESALGVQKSPPSWISLPPHPIPLGFKIRCMMPPPPYQGPGTQSWSAPGAWWAAVLGSWICRCQGKSGGSCTGQPEKFWPQRAGQTRVCERKYATPEATEVLVTGIKLWSPGRQSPRR